MFAIYQYKEKIKAICDSLSIRRLDMVGSATRDDFDAEKSDIDVWSNSKAPRYFELKEKLEVLLKKQVDVIQQGAVKNPYVKKTIERDKDCDIWNMIQRHTFSISNRPGLG